MADKRVMDNLVNLADLEWLDLSDLIRMDEEWRKTLVLVSRLHLGLSFLLALGVLATVFILRPEDVVTAAVLTAGVLISVALMAYLIWRAREDEARLLANLRPVVALSLLAVTFVVYLLRGQQGDFYLLYFLPLISAAGYLMFTGGLVAGLGAAVLYALVIALTYPLTAPIVTTLVLRGIIFVLVSGLFGLIAERHLSLLEALRASHTQAIQLAVSDTKTGLFNQRYLASRLRSEIGRADRAHLSVSFVVMDVNNMAQINRDYGYAMGDEVLRVLGRTVQKQLRVTDIPSRWGPDEFGILLYNSDAAGAEVVARRMVQDVAQTTFTDPASGRTCNVQVTLGIASYPGHTQDRSGNELADRAYEALRQAKQAGSRIAIWGGNGKA
jgi:diguanylate cyclase (GGDEF)-like protein